MNPQLERQLIIKKLKDAMNAASEEEMLKQCTEYLEDRGIIVMTSALLDKHDADIQAMALEEFKQQQYDIDHNGSIPRYADAERDRIIDLHASYECRTDHYAKEDLEHLDQTVKKSLATDLAYTLLSNNMIQFDVISDYETFVGHGDEITIWRARVDVVQPKPKITK